MTLPPRNIHPKQHSEKPCTELPWTGFKPVPPQLYSGTLTSWPTSAAHLGGRNMQCNKPDLQENIVYSLALISRLDIYMYMYPNYIHVHLHVHVHVRTCIINCGAKNCLYFTVLLIANSPETALYTGSCTCWQHIQSVMYMKISKNHNSLGCEQPLGLDVNQSPDVQHVHVCTHAHCHVYMYF